MRILFRPLGFAMIVIAGSAAVARGQSAAGSAEAVRVTVSMNADGSRTTYEWDTANHKATATTLSGGKLREKILYQLDDAGKFATGQVFGPTSALRFTTKYKYDEAGRLAEEAQLTKEGAVDHRIVYVFDSAGKQIGYTVYDGKGQLLGQTTSPAAKASR